MPWCWSMWITRNRANPGNRIVDGYWGPGTGPWCFEPLIHGKRDPDRSDQTLMRCSRMLTKWRVLGAPLRKCQLPSRHIENILKWPKRTSLSPQIIRVFLDKVDRVIGHTIVSSILVPSLVLSVMIRLFLFFHLFTSCALSHDPQSVSLSIAAQCLKVTTCCCAMPHL